MNVKAELINYFERTDTTGRSLASIAREAIEAHGLDIHPENARKILSKYLNGTKAIKKKVVAEVKPEVQTSDKIYKRKNKFTTPGMYVVVGCVHVPGENKPMFKGICDLLKDYRNEVKGLMLIGDFLDMHSLSSHNRDEFTAIPGLTLKEEYKAGNVALDKLTAHLRPEVDKVFIYGNHEDRWNRHMKNMQNAKTPLDSPAEALHLSNRGFNVFTNWSADYVTLGNHLELMHGQYYNTHCAKAHIDKLRGSVMFAHSHRIQMYVEGKTGGFNIGWGGDIQSPLFNYMERATKSQWQNGFAIVNIDKDGTYFVQQIFCNNDKFFFNNKQYGKYN